MVHQDLQTHQTTWVTQKQEQNKTEDLQTHQTTWITKKQEQNKIEEYKNERKNNGNGLKTE